MKRANATVLAGCLAVLFVLAYSGRQALADPASDVTDLERVRGMGNAFAIYEKKYRYFPALTDVSKAKDITAVREKGNCLAMKLLLSGGFVEDAELFFSPRTGKPDAKTLAAITKDSDPTKDTTWACSFAYDAGHSAQQATAVYFGTPGSWATQHPEDIVHAITGAGVAKQIEMDATKSYQIKARIPGGTATQDDDIYADNSDTLKTNDSWLQLDVPTKIGK